MSPLPQRPCDNLQERFDEAAKLRIPPYNWVPPVWDKLGVEGVNRRLTDNCEPDDDFFVNTRGDVAARLKELDEAVDGMVKGRRLASPLEDFSHVDPDQLSDDDIATVGKSDVPGGKPRRDELLRKLEALAGSKSPGMARLDGVFQWILAKFEGLCARLNQALDGGNEGDYTKLRGEYLECLRDLDDHEPQRQGIEKLKPGERGYGRVVKWVHVAPTILQGRIVELRVIVHWNPHSSSSGKPILHG